MENRILARQIHSHFLTLGYQIEFSWLILATRGGKSRMVIQNCARNYILVAVILVNSLSINFKVRFFVCNYVKKLYFCLNLFECLINLLYFNGGYGLHLSLSDSISIQNDSLRVSPIHLFEVLKGFAHEHD